MRVPGSSSRGRLDDPADGTLSGAEREKDTVQVLSSPAVGKLQPWGDDRCRGRVSPRP
jgi:hypothetical protein